MKSRFLFIALLASFLVNAAPPVEEGKSIFTTRCAGCHNINKQVLGPALAGVDERRSMDWIINFVHSSQSLIKSGDKDAVALFKEFNNIPMPDHKDLTDEQIKNVVEYINVEAKGAAGKKEVAPPIAELNPSLFQSISDSPALITVFSILLMLLIGTLVFAYQVAQYKRRMAIEK